MPNRTVKVVNPNSYQGSEDDQNEEQIEESEVIDDANSENSSSLKFLDSASPITQSEISRGSETGSLNKGGSKGTLFEDNASDSGGGMEDQFSVVTIRSN